MKLTYFTALFLFLIAPCAFAQIEPNRTVLTVNGDEVKGDEYYRRMEFLPGVGKRMGAGFTEVSPGLLTIDQIVTDRLTLQLAKEKGVFPSDLELDAEYAERLKENPDLLDLWKQSGRTEAELKNQVRLDLAQFKIATFGITVTDQEVERIYRERSEEFLIPRQYKLSVIVVLNEAAKQSVDDDLKAGKSFTDVARARSEDVSKVTGGQYGTLPEKSLGTVVREALRPTKPNETTPWITTNLNDAPAFVKFRVEDIIPEKKEELTPQLRRRIRKNRMLELGRVKNDIVKEMAALRRKSKIEIKNPELAKAYFKLIEAYLSQPSTGG
jgi:foldase protein PrsA